MSAIATFNSPKEFHKTKMCLNYKIGCSYPGCTFAHSKDELRVRMCKFGDKCKIKVRCWHYHPGDVMPTQDELFHQETLGIKFNEKIPIEIKNLPVEVEVNALDDLEALKMDIYSEIQNHGNDQLIELLQEVEDIEEIPFEFMEEMNEINDEFIYQEILENNYNRIICEQQNIINMMMGPSMFYPPPMMMPPPPMPMYTPFHFVNVEEEEEEEENVEEIEVN